MFPIFTICFIIFLLICLCKDIIVMSIEVRNLVKKFDDKVVIDDISFKVDDGEILAIVGFSGSGKSTFLKTFFIISP